MSVNPLRWLRAWRHLNDEVTKDQLIFEQRIIIRDLKSGLSDREWQIELQRHEIERLKTGTGAK